MYDDQNQQFQDHLANMDRPIPGESLTEDPDIPQSYVGSPEFTKPQEALDYLFTVLSGESSYVPMMSALAENSTVMEMTQMILYAGFNEGKWNPDLMMLLIEPTAYMIMALAERADIDYVVTDDEDDDMFGATLGSDRLESLESTEVPEGAEGIADKVAAAELPSLMSKPEAPPPDSPPSLMGMQ
jgi:hypothetical protein|tara:strand:- start:152 stop:706 length:555 start_codon:yes stop_codon:yes gene_type:complete